MIFSSDAQFILSKDQKPTIETFIICYIYINNSIKVLQVNTKLSPIIKRFMLYYISSHEAAKIKLKALVLNQSVMYI